ncbi:MAG TPA: hypothetical protein VFU22_15550 [Roseiflexaceae bacterium]|nr:hypothetical protein [Roseiflexaceae bacterium]
MNDWIEFNIHNALTMRVARSAPTAALLKDIFAPFVTKGLTHYDLTIRGEIEPMHEATHAETDYLYTDTAVLLNDIKVQAVRDGDTFRLNGSRELLVTALPLIDRILVMHGVAMIHAATVEYRGHGICMPAWGGTGKTSTIAKLLKMDGFAFMGDDWAFISQDGCLLGYAKPMFIKPHHRPIYPHLFTKKSKPLVPTKLSRPLGRLTTMVHPLITQYPRLARVSRRFSPENMMVTPRDAFPTARFSTAAPLATAIFVERYDGTRPVLEEKSKSWMVTRLIGNFHAEIKPDSHALMTALGATGIVPIEQAFSEKAAVLDRAIEGKPVYLMQIPQQLSPGQASDMIVEQLHKVLPTAVAV